MHLRNRSPESARRVKSAPPLFISLFPNPFTINDLYRRVEVVSPSLTGEQFLREKTTEFSRAGQRSSSVMEQR